MLISHDCTVCSNANFPSQPPTSDSSSQMESMKSDSQTEFKAV